MPVIPDNIDLYSLPGTVMKYILPWFEVVGEAIRVGRRGFNGLATEGTYEGLDLRMFSSQIARNKTQNGFDKLETGLF